MSSGEPRGDGDGEPVLVAEMNAVGAGLYVAGGVLVVLVLLVTDWEGVRRGWLTLFGANALVAGAGLYVASRLRPLPVWSLHLLAVAGTANITGTIVAAGGEGSGPFGVLYVFVSAFSFYYFPFYAAVAHVALTAIAYGVALSLVAVPDPLSSWLVISGAIAIVGGLLGRVGQRVRWLLRRQVAATAQLRELDELKTAFLRAVSHELRTPLTTLIGYTHTLQTHHDRLSREQVDQLLDRAVANAERLDKLLGDLLDIDRVSRGVLSPRLEPTDVGRLVRTVVAELRPETHDLNLDAEAVIVPVEASKVERIVENLVANAVRHTPAGTTVWVRVRATAPGGCVIAVEDEGPGVPDELKGPLFEPFVQGPLAATSPKPGTGIGLSLVARFTELHGGRAWVEDRPGGGARFCVELPGGAAEAPH